MTTRTCYTRNEKNKVDERQNRTKISKCKLKHLLKV